MIYVVLVLVLLNFALTICLYDIVRRGDHFHQIDYTSDVPYLQLIAEDLDDLNEPKDFIGDFERQQIEQINAQNSVPGSDGPWRNQKNIDPWAPNSSANSGGVPDRKPLERPPGFV